jgi:hypothetical protein
MKNKANYALKGLVFSAIRRNNNPFFCLDD